LLLQGVPCSYKRIRLGMPFVDIDFLKGSNFTSRMVFGGSSTSLSG
jgi:hypothetical protein